MIEYTSFIDSKIHNRVHCFKSMIQTLTAILHLTQSVCETKYERSKFFFILTSRLNQDCLENFFSQIRSRVPTNNNRSLFEFNAFIAKLITMKVISSHSAKANCEEDFVNMLTLDTTEIPDSAANSDDVQSNVYNDNDGDDDDENNDDENDDVIDSNVK